MACQSLSSLLIGILVGLTSTALIADPCSKTIKAVERIAFSAVRGMVKEQDAMDLVQETFLDLMKYRPELSEADAPLVLITARRKALEFHRKRYCQKCDTRRTVPFEESADTQSDVEGAAYYREIWAEVEKLPEPLKRIVELRFSGFSFTDIGGELELAEPKVRRLFYKAQQSLSYQLQGYVN